MSAIDNAAKMAMDGLEMGFRVLGSRINEVLADCHVKDRINCGPKKDGDSMATARDLLIRSLPVLAPLEVRHDQIFDQWPWVLGYPSGFGETDEERQTMKWVCRVRLGDNPSGEDSVIENYKSKDWSSDIWRARVIEPMESYHTEVAGWIKEKSPLGLPLDDTQAAIELCKRWCEVHRDRGGPAEGQRDFLQALIEIGGSAEANDIDVRLGSAWNEPRGSCQGYKDRINKLAKLERWEIAESNGKFHIRLKS